MDIHILRALPAARTVFVSLDINYNMQSYKKNNNQTKFTCFFMTIILLCAIHIPYQPVYAVSQAQDWLIFHKKRALAAGAITSDRKDRAGGKG